MSWSDDMDRAMEEHPEWFGLEIDYMGNPVPRRSALSFKIDKELLWDAICEATEQNEGWDFRTVGTSWETALPVIVREYNRLAAEVRGKADENKRERLPVRRMRPRWLSLLCAFVMRVSRNETR